jgi:RNA polymerase sigma-70 factor (ECF subfamily)
MDLNSTQLQQRLAEAQSGSREALGLVLSQYREYLKTLARRELAHDLQAKGDPSDLVQETFLEAQRTFDRFHGHSDDALRAWLRCLLMHRCAKVGRQFRTTQKRRLTREVSLGFAQSHGVSDQGPGARAALSPSACMMAREREESLRQAVDSLPEAYRQVMHLRYFEEQTFEQIGRVMGRSADAVRMLWGRALERLKHELRSLPGSL